MSQSTTAEIPVVTAWRTYQGAAGEKIDEEGLISRYLPLVRDIVDRIKINLPAHVDTEDLYSVGVTGLLAAVRKFDPAKMSTFTSYARKRIRGAVIDELRRLDWCPRRARAKARLIQNAMAELEQEKGRAPTEAEVQERLGLTQREFTRWIEDTRPVSFVALDQAADAGDDEGASLHEAIPDPGHVPVPDQMEHAELVQLVAKRIEQLPDLQKKILSMYYFENMRLAEIAAVFGLTESRICQIHSQAVLSLRAYLSRARNR